MAPLLFSTWAAGPSRLEPSAVLAGLAARDREPLRLGIHETGENSGVALELQLAFRTEGDTMRPQGAQGRKRVVL